MVGEDPLTYRQLDTLAARFATHLDSIGVTSVHRVCLQLPNSAAFLVAYFGALHVGAAVVPISPQLREREVAHVLQAAQVDFLVHSEHDPVTPGSTKNVALPLDSSGLDNALPGYATPDYQPRSSTDPAVIMFTSGTTGRPKGAVLTHSNMLWSAQIAALHLEISSDDVSLLAVPAFHILGQSFVVNASLIAGAAVLPIARFNPPDCLNQMARHKVSTALGVPAMFWGLLQAARHVGERLPDMRLACVGGAPVPAELVRTFEAYFDTPIYEGYGMSETAGVAIANSLHRPRIPGSAGQPVWGVHARVVSPTGAVVRDGTPGELHLRGHSIMAGYYGLGDDTSAVMHPGGWMATGDIAKIDDDGEVYIIDRAKDVIIRNGFNVYPREVEDVLLEHPALTNAAVVGLPHHLHGEEIAAICVATQETPSVEEIQAFVAQRLAPYKYPRYVSFVDELPLGPSGKVLRRAVDLSCFPDLSGAPQQQQ